MKSLILISGFLGVLLAASAQDIPYWLKGKKPITIQGSVIQTTANSIKVAVETKIPQHELRAGPTQRDPVRSVLTGYKDVVVCYLVKNYQSASRPVDIGDTISVTGIEDTPLGTDRVIYYVSGGGSKMLGSHRVPAQAVASGQRPTTPDRVNNPPGSFGTGFVVATGGRVLTCSHVIKNALRITVVAHDCKKHPASIIINDEANDWCLLGCPSLEGPPIPMASKESVKVGASVYNLGYPFTTILQNATPVAGNGVIASLQGIDGDPRHIQVTLPINPGSSGSPVLDEYGSWIGLASHKLNDITALAADGSVPQGINFAVKASLIDVLAQSKVTFSSSTTNATKKLSLTELSEKLGSSIVLIDTIKRPSTVRQP